MVGGGRGHLYSWPVADCKKKVLLLLSSVVLLLFGERIFYITSIVGSSALGRGSSNQGRVDLNEHARRWPAQVRLFLENTGGSKELILSTEYRDALSGSNVLN
jgi:hypothetical protein